MSSSDSSPASSLDLSAALRALHRGDLSYRLPAEGSRADRELAAAHNQYLDRMQQMRQELCRIAREAGTQGRFGGQAEISGLEGSWASLLDAVNMMVSNLTDQFRDLASTITAIANGDLARKMTVGCEGEIVELERTINTMVDQLNAFVFELTVVARNTGTDSKLGAQGAVRGISGSWKDVLASVNSMSETLATQIRTVTDVISALANGDNTRRVAIAARGEMLRLKERVNVLADRLEKMPA